MTLLLSGSEILIYFCVNSGFFAASLCILPAL